MKEFLVHSVFFGAAVSLIGYEAGLLLKRKFKMAIFNPLLIAILCVRAILTVGDISYDDYKLSQYFQFLILPYHQLVVPVDYKKDFFLCQEFFTLYPL